MKLKYVGPKEMISIHGISFKSGKDDKYVYIDPAIEIYHAIHHDYEKDKVYTHLIEKKVLTDEEILSEILRLKPNLKTTSNKEITQLELKLDEEIENVNNHKDLTSEEQKIYKNNLIIMKNYRIQRETNKIIYNHLIEIIVDDIIEHKLKNISAPFNERFWHVFQTIQGELSNHHKRSIGSKLDIIYEEPISISLKINSIGK